jgi:hypothetical protein
MFTSFAVDRAGIEERGAKKAKQRHLLVKTLLFESAPKTSAKTLFSAQGQFDLRGLWHVRSLSVLYGGSAIRHGHSGGIRRQV